MNEIDLVCNVDGGHSGPGLTQIICFLHYLSSLYATTVLSSANNVSNGAEFRTWNQISYSQSTTTKTVHKGNNDTNPYGQLAFVTYI